MPLPDGSPLRHTLVHVPGIGPAKEQRLWQRGVTCWQTFREAAPRVYKGDRARSVLELLEATEEAADAGDLRYFYRILPRHALWRIVPGHEDDAAYLDIESTGAGQPPYAQSTVIAVYFRGELYQEHDFARKRELLDWIDGACSYYVTYNGETFDLPFLRRELGLPLTAAHVDLCFWLRRLGYKGGLKRVQGMFPDIPQRASLDIDGFDAVRLWFMHERGVPNALETLMTYNAEDTVVLAPLLTHAVRLELEKWQALAAPGPLREAPAPPRLPLLQTSVCFKVYEALKGHGSILI